MQPLTPSQQNDRDERLRHALSNPPGPRHARPVSTATAEDNASAFAELEAWIRRGPADRHVRRIARTDGMWSVGLQVDEQELTASRDAELHSAIRNALMIATFAGYR
jgi:hypothetical protein